MKKSSGRKLQGKQAKTERRCQTDSGEGSSPQEETEGQEEVGEGAEEESGIAWGKRS